MATFDENGNYIKTDWKDGDKITALRLNKMEAGIASACNDSADSEEVDARLDAIEAGRESDKQEMNAKMDAMEDKIAAADASMEAMVAEIEADLESIDSRFTHIENNIYNNPIKITDYADKKEGDDWATVFNYLIEQGYRNIIIPAGEYRFLTPANLIGGLKVSGQFGIGFHSTDRTLIKPTTIAFRFPSNKALYQNQDITIENIMFEGGTNVIDLGLCHCVSITNCTLDNFEENGIILTRGERHIFKNITFWAKSKEFNRAFAFADKALSTHTDIRNMDFGVDGEWIDRLVIENCTTMNGSNTRYNYSLWGGNKLSHATIHNMYCHGGRNGVLYVNTIQQSDFRNWVMDGWTEADNLIHIGKAYDSNISSVSPGFAGNNIYNTGMFLGYSSGVVVQSCTATGNNVDKYGFRTANHVNQNATFIGCRGAYYSEGGNDLIRNQISHIGCAYTHTNTSATSLYTGSSNNEIHTLMSDSNGATKSTGIVRYQYARGSGNPGILFEISENKIRIGQHGTLIITGNGDPNGVVNAPISSIYLNKEGGVGTTLYVKESGGSTNIGWVAK